MTARVLVKTQRRRWRVVGKGEEKPPPLRRQFSIHPRRRKACRRRERLTNNRGINYPGCWLRLSPRLPAPERTPQGVEQPHSEILRQVYGYLTRLCDWTMPKPSVVMPDWMMDEIDDRRHSRTDRSEWIRGAIQARLDAEDRGDWDD